MKKTEPMTDGEIKRIIKRITDLKVVFNMTFDEIDDIAASLRAYSRKVKNSNRKK